MSAFSTIEPSLAVHVVQRMAPGGIETFVLDLARRHDCGNAVVSLEGTHGGLLAEWPALASIREKLTCLDSRPGLQPGLAIKLARVLRHVRPKAVIVHHIGPLLYGGVAARLAGVRRVIHIEHDVWHYTTSPSDCRITSALERLLRPRHVCQSEESAVRLRDILPRADITVIPTGIDLERFRPADRRQARARLGLLGADKLIGSVGRLVPVKDYGSLIAALKVLPDRVHLALAGDGPEKPALEMLACRLGVRNRVSFLGHRDDIAEILPAFDVFCLPSLNEGVPRSLLEAQACGVPVVATDVGSVREAVCTATGFLVKPSSLESLVEGLGRALCSQPLRSPRQFVEQRYSWARTLDAYSRLVEA